MALILPDRRLEYPGLMVPGREPTVPVQIDRAHQIGGKVAYCNLFNKVSYDIYQGMEEQLFGNAYIDDYGLNLAANSSYSAVNSSIDFDLSDHFTVFIVATPVYYSGAAYPVFISRGDTGSGEWMFRWWVSDKTLRIYGHSGSLNATSASNVIVPSIEQSIAMTRDGSIWSAFHNGEFKVSDSSLFSVSNSKSLQIGYGDIDDLRSFYGGIRLVFGFNSVLGDNEILSLHNNPYQFLVPA